jgi:hypothetical protein
MLAFATAAVIALRADEPLPDPTAVHVVPFQNSSAVPSVFHRKVPLFGEPGLSAFEPDGTLRPPVPPIFKTVVLSGVIVSVVKSKTIA